MVIRIVDWASRFENNRTRELKHLDWVPIPNRMDDDGYTQLVDHPDGGAHLGAWLAIVQIASRADKKELRGTLLRSGGKVPHDPQSLARISRLPAALFEQVIERLKEINWIECISLEELDINSGAAALVTPNGKGHHNPPKSVHQDSSPHDDATIPQAIATAPHDDAALRARAGAHSQKGKKEGKGTERREGKERKNGHFPDSMLSPEQCEEFLRGVGWGGRDVTDEQVQQILNLDPYNLPDLDGKDTLPGIYARLDQFQNHFWPKYWRKVALKAARESWMRATEDFSVIGDILRAEERQTPAMLKREPEARPHGSTWLNGKRWNDEIEEVNA